MNEDYSGWVGRSENREDVLSLQRCEALRIALGCETPLAIGARLPNLYHWLYFWDVRPPSGIGVDGHPAKGGFLPPVPFPRRMWAGGRVDFLQPLHIGESVLKTSTITRIESKTGRSGSLMFVTLKHELSGASGTAIIEEQDLVYREATSGAAPASMMPDDQPAPSARWAETVMPDPVLLFRYSALTMNGHRIHYDRDYAVKEEAYPGLVVHGPLQATMLAALAGRAAGRDLAKFSFRGASPAFEGAALHVCADEAEEGLSLRTVQNGKDCMTATAMFG